jgi:transposase
MLGATVIAACMTFPTKAHVACDVPESGIPADAALHIDVDGGGAMARAYSQDLRDRVIDAALGGMPARRAAAQFEIGIATAIVWVRRARASGERMARRQGQPRRSKLDPQRDFLLGLVEQTPDMTIIEMQQRLAAERDIKASVGTIWTFLDRCGLTFKKSPRTRRSGIGPTS